MSAALCPESLMALTHSEMSVLENLADAKQQQSVRVFCERDGHMVGVGEAVQ